MKNKYVIVHDTDRGRLYYNSDYDPVFLVKHPTIYTSKKNAAKVMKYVKCLFGISAVEILQIYRDGKEYGIKHEIEHATAYYTGGGIYIYRGKLTNGLYFSSCDTWESISLCFTNTDVEDANYQEFYEQYQIDEVSGRAYEKLFNKMLSWIIKNKPDGNYSLSELEDRIIQRVGGMKNDR